MTEISKKNGFVQSLFNGVIDKDLFKAFPSYTDDEKEEMHAILDTVNKFAQEKIDPEKIDRDHHIPDSVKEGMKELGLWGLIIPEEYDGFEQPEMTYNKTMEILTGRCGSTAVMYGGHLSIGLKAILLFGTDEQKKKFLPALAAGEELAGFALTEPNAGSDAAGVKTTAELSEDGTYYTLNGRKQWITNGGFAEVFTVFAKIKAPDGTVDASRTTAFIVRRDMEGFSSGKEEDKMGICGSSTTPLYLDNVKVPAENMLGEIGGGFRIAMEVLNTGRLGLGAGCIGAAKALIPHALQFASQREQFKKKIGEFEMVKEKFARILITTFTGESIAYFTTCMKGYGDVPVAVEAALSKAYSSEALWETVNDCLQVAGGNGFMKEYPYERFLRDARINLIFEGTNEILRMFIAMSGLRQPSVQLKKHQKNLSEDPAEKGKQIDNLFKEISVPEENFNIDGFSDILCTQTSIASKMSKRFYEVLTKAVLRHGRSLRDMQYIQKRLAEISIDLYGIFANIARVENLISRDHHSADKAILISDTFARQAEKRIDQNLDEIENNHDDDLNKIAEILYEAEKYPFDILDY
ncbi:MAG: acyl-CoA dehydrogenase [bacterium]|nr:acyl-CoA dehydrogenase [bacterium]